MLKYGDFSIHLRSHLRVLMGDANDIPAAGKTRDAELCFETDEIGETMEAVVWRFHGPG